MPDRNADTARVPAASVLCGAGQGSLSWALFYGGFVVAVSIHGAIGVRTVLSEWAGLRGGVLNGVCLSLCALLLVMGGRAVLAVTVI